MKLEDLIVGEIEKLPQYVPGTRVNYDKEIVGNMEFVGDWEEGIRYIQRESVLEIIKKIFEYRTATE